MSPEDEVRDCQRYSDTVALFYILKDALDKAGAKVEVEQDRKTPVGQVRCPDFLVVDHGDIIDVLEHKGSLTDPAHTLEEFNDVAKKYAEFDTSNGISRPQVTLLYPARQRSVVDRIRTQVDSKLTLCAFDQTSSDTSLSFKLEGKVTSTVLDGVLRGPPIIYEPAIVRSTYKFIRSDPPTAYIASEVWRVFPGMRNVKEADQTTHEVARSVLLTRMKDFYPPWIRGNDQVNSARIDRALTFLHLAKFIDWSPGSNKIRVNSSRGTRSGDLLETFARLYVKMNARRGKKVPRGIPRGQKTLDQFPR
jgi:hypothetical protein